MEIKNSPFKSPCLFMKGLENERAVIAVLNGKDIKAKLTAMNSIAMCSGSDVSKFFPLVAKNVVIPDIGLKKMVYLYLVSYSEQCPQDTLMAINEIQKDTKSPDILIKAHALRILSSIRVPMIQSVVLVQLQSAIVDQNPYVRRVAANALPKVFSLNKSSDTYDQVIEMLKKLLTDRLTTVLGSAIVAFCEICPTRYDLIHPHYRKICHLLADCNEWAQVKIIDLLLKYGRAHFIDPNAKKIPQNENGVDSDKPLTSFDDNSNLVDSDHRALLTATLPLLKTRNSAVVLAVSMLHFYLAPEAESEKYLAKPLISRLVHAEHPSTSFVILQTIAAIASERPSLFSPYVTEFVVHLDSDPAYVSAIKLDIMSLIANPHNQLEIVKEIKQYLRSSSVQLVMATIRTLRSIGSRFPQISGPIALLFGSLLKHPESHVVSEAILSLPDTLRSYLMHYQSIDAAFEQNPSMFLNSSSKSKKNKKKKKKIPPLFDRVYRLLVKFLVRQTDTKNAPNPFNSTLSTQAYRCLIYTVGYWAGLFPQLIPDAFRVCVRRFPKVPSSVKFAILYLGSTAIMLNQNPEKVVPMYEYLLKLARYDLDVQIRGQERLLTAVLMSRQTPTNGQIAAPLSPVLFNSSVQLFGISTQKVCQDRKLDMKQFIKQQKKTSGSSFALPVYDINSEKRQTLSVLPGRRSFPLTTLSQHVSHRVRGYQPLPEHPLTPSDPTLRVPFGGEHWGSSGQNTSSSLHPVIQTSNAPVSLEEFLATSSDDDVSESGSDAEVEPDSGDFWNPSSSDDELESFLETDEVEGKDSDADEYETDSDEYETESDDEEETESDEYETDDEDESGEDESDTEEDDEPASVIVTAGTTKGITDNSVVVFDAPQLIPGSSLTPITVSSDNAPTLTLVIQVYRYLVVQPLMKTLNCRITISHDSDQDFTIQSPQLEPSDSPIPSTTNLGAPIHLSPSEPTVVDAVFNLNPDCLISFSIASTINNQHITWSVKTNCPPGEYLIPKHMSAEEFKNLSNSSQSASISDILVPTEHQSSVSTWFTSLVNSSIPLKCNAAVIFQADPSKLCFAASSLASLGKDVGFSVSYTLISSEKINFDIQVFGSESKLFLSSLCAEIVDLLKSRLSESE